MNHHPRSLLRTAALALAALSALGTLLLLILTFALPGWVVGRGATLAGETLGRPVLIEQAHVEPWRLALVIDGVRVAGPAADRPPLLTLARLDAALSLRSLLRGHVVFESLVLTRPELRVARLADGHYDIDDLLAHFAAKPGDPPADEPDIAIYNIELQDGRVLFDDRPVQRQHELAGLHLALPFLSTLDSDVKVTVQPHLSGQLDGVAFDSRVEALPFADDASGRFSLKLAGLDLAPLGAYLPASLPLRLAAGRLDVDLTLDFAERTRQTPDVKLTGALQVHDLSLTQPSGQPWLALKHLTLPLSDVQPLRRRVALGTVRLEAPQGWLRPWPATTGSSVAGPPWQFSLGGLALSDGELHAGELTLDAIQLKTGAADWPLARPTTLNLGLRLGDGTLTAQALLSTDELDVQARAQGLPMARLAPWLPLPGGAKLVATLSGQLALQVKQPLVAGAADRAQLKVTEVDARNVQALLAGQPLLTVAEARLDRADIDPAARQLKLGTLTLDAPRGQLARTADGRLNIDALRPPEVAGSNGPGWTLQLAGLQIDRGSLRWRDVAVPAGTPEVALTAEPLRLQLGAFTWPATDAVPVQLSTRLAAQEGGEAPGGGGQLQWNGRLGLAPLSASGSLKAQGLPVQWLSAYLDAAWGVQLQRAELGLVAELNGARQPDGTWQARLEGDARIGPLALLQTRLVDGQRVAGEDLLSFQALQLDGLRLSLAPGTPTRVAVRDATLDDGYARLIVNEQGRFNLRDLRPAAAASAAAPVQPTASAPSAELAVERLRVNRGLVDFNDRFIKPHYSARLSELQGSLGAFSTTGTAMAPLTLRGKIAGTGQLAVDGQLKPGSPLAMDVDAQASDIELAPLSGYAGKYVGYGIERGKLSARLHYQLDPGGQLVASNQITLNQLTFGERVDSPDATTLPVRFAVSLLKDRNGVIEVNLPVSGSLNDPEFSVGGLVWRLVLNLVGKALTSPFSLFSGSDSPEEAQIAFAPGSAELAAGEQLERIARQLADKPAVQLTLTGWADSETEVPALRELHLAAALQAQRAATPEAALKRLYDATSLPNKPRNVLGLPKELPPAQMRGLLMARDDVDDEALRQLAVARAVAVRDALLARGAPNARVFLGPPKLCNGACDSGWRPHVEISLDAP
ncbi:DUF748 domain-containing protein [Roseateles cellulosilyticus]|uniref:DUF748 domain-containing protein n=1 Tax=Pelomonas cellulosilytica TaxID=2906762 RepID=A0ABS8XX10_9BURK|nr:DUF748 domain-containing protein [Pelomonas sp. P8]